MLKLADCADEEGGKRRDAGDPTLPGAAGRGRDVGFIAGSGATAAQDEACAMAGAEKIASRIK